MRNRGFCFKSLAIALVGLTCFAWSGAARAYDSETHQAVVDTAWEIMLASQDPALTTNRDLFTTRATVPQSLRIAPAGIPQADWDVFLEDVKRGILAINRWPTGLRHTTKPGCEEIQAGGVTLGNVTKRIGIDYFGVGPAVEGDFDNSPKCAGPEYNRAGIFGAIGRSPGTSPICGDADPRTCGSAACPVTAGICVDSGGLRGDFGNTIGQGLILGWHSKAMDDAKRDVILNFNPAQAAINLPLPWLGGLSLRQFFGVPVFLVVAAVVCLGNFITGNGEDCLANARRVSNLLNPATFVASLFPTVGADQMSQDFVGLPHFINGEDGTGSSDNWYNDRRGMWQERGGGLIDDLIVAGAELTGKVVDYADANMIVRYDLGDDVPDMHPVDPDHRGRFNWIRDTIGHIQMTPLDNLAFHGWQIFAQDPQLSARSLRWPLHALGDASVPMHVRPSTGRGHRPYENALKRIPNIKKVRFEGENFSQLEQARIILRQAFELRNTWRPFAGPETFPIRLFVTDLARRTARQSHSMPGAPDDWPYCDTCSMQWHSGFTGAATDHYTTDEMLGRSRVLFQDSVAYTLAFLLAASDVPLRDRICVEPTDFPNRLCSPTDPCCVGTCDPTGQCVVSCPTEAGTCDANRLCPHDDPQNPRLCVNCYCTGGNDCTNGTQCPTGLCENGFCECHPSGGACTSNVNCCGGVCSIPSGQTSGTCAACAGVSVSCMADADCCSGVCQGGVCRPAGPGGGCTTTADCIVGNCVNGVCVPDCTVPSDCPNGQGCVNGRCCGAQNGACNNDGDCCSAGNACQANVCRPQG